MTAAPPPAFRTIEGSTTVLLLGRDVRSWLLVEKDLYRDLLAGAPPEGLQRKLYARGLGTLDGRSLARAPDDRASPIFFVLDVSDRCNLACSYCIRRPLKHRVLKPTVLRQILEEVAAFAKAQDSEVYLQPFGGEPLLALDAILEAQEFLDGRGIPHTISLQTNGTLISPSVARVLRERCVQVSLSLDGDGPVHDAHRVTPNGRGSFDLVRRGFENLVDAGFSPSTIGALCTLTRASAEKLDTIVDLFVDDLGLESFRFGYPYLLPDQSADDFITPDEYGAVAKRLIRIIRAKAAAGKQAGEAALSARVRGFLHNDITDICWSGPCRMGSRMLAYDIDGNRYPCSELTGLRTGSIGQAGDGMSGRAQAVESAIREQHRVRTPVACAGCAYQPWCEGGCRVSPVYGSFNGQTRREYVCAFTRAVLDEVVNCLLAGRHDLLEPLQ